jgi:hypothetical protein
VNDILERIALIMDEEGDFTPAEHAAMKKMGLEIMRADTVPDDVWLAITQRRRKTMLVSYMVACLETCARA